jgi:hypothetical protein
MGESVDPSSTTEQAAKAALQKQCDEEFARYGKERETLLKAELEAEKSFDTTLVTISTLAIGSSFTVFKDVVKAGSATPLIVLAWILLGVCLFSALTDRLLSYFAHMKWRDMLDDEFNNWVANGGAGAWERVLPKYEQIAGVKILRALKWVSFGSLAGGVLFLMLFVISSSPQTQAPAVPVTVNQYNGTTQPSRP